MHFFSSVVSFCATNAIAIAVAMPAAAVAPPSSTSGVAFLVANHQAELVSKLSSTDQSEQHFVQSTKEYLNEGCIEVLGGSPFDPPRFVKVSNGFVHGVLDAYNRHHNLFIRPDDVWLSIVVQFSLHVNHDPEAMRSVFVEHSGKKELVVRDVGTLRNANYGRLSRKMGDLLKENLRNPNIADWILPSFSTTTPHDTIVGSVALMATMKSYFDYKFCLRCGIPEVLLAGTTEDWEDIHRRVVELARYGGTCATWSSLLQKITVKLVETSRGIIDTTFWSKICHYMGGGSGPTYISGWISAFTVFNAKGEWQGSNFKASWRLRGEGENMLEFPVIETGDIAPGYATVDVNVDDNGVIHKTMMFCGHMGYGIAEDGKGIVPNLLWAIALKKKEDMIGKICSFPSPFSHCQCL